jgi:hypothetical protein
MTLAASVAVAALQPARTMAQEVGAATAVNPLSESTPPSGETRTLKIGARIMHKERIKTTAAGNAQLLFVDKSTLNIGPGSTVVIDSFVYDPAAGVSDKAATLTRGALRFVGGSSRKGAATITTPVATIGIRG